MLRVIQTNTQSILTVSHMSAIFLRSQEHRGGTLSRIFGIIDTGIGQLRRPILIHIFKPLANGLLGMPVRDVAVFEVKQDIGTLAESQLDGRRRDRIIVLVNSGKCRTGDCGVVSGGELQALNDTRSSGVHGAIKDFIREIHIVMAVFHQHFQIDGLVVWHRGLVQSEGNLGGIHNVNGGRSHNLTIVHDLNSHIALGTIGLKDTIFNGAKAGIGQSPCNILRYLGRSVGFVGTGCGEGISRVGNEIIIAVVVDHGMIKDARGHCGRNDHQSIGNRTLAAASRGIHKSKLILTLANSAKGGGVAAVQVNCFHTAQGEHDLSLLLNGNTNSDGIPGTVSGQQDQLAICRQTNGLTGIQGGLVQAGYHLAVLNQMDVALDSFLDLALVGGILTLGTDHVGAVLQHSKESIAVAVASGDIHTLHDEGTQRLTVGGVVVSRIDTRDDLEGFGVVGLHRSDLIAQGLHTIDSILVVHVVCHDLDRVKSRIDRGHIHLNTLFSAVMHNQFVHGNARSQGRLVIVDHSEVCYSERILHIHGKDLHRQHCDDHHNCQCHCTNTFHDFFSFRVFRNVYKTVNTILYQKIAAPPFPQERFFQLLKTLSPVCDKGMVCFLLFHRRLRHIVTVKAGQVGIVSDRSREHESLKLDLDYIIKCLRRDDPAIAPNRPGLDTLIAASILTRFDAFFCNPADIMLTSVQAAPGNDPLPQQIFHWVIRFRFVHLHAAKTHIIMTDPSHLLPCLFKIIIPVVQGEDVNIDTKLHTIMGIIDLCQGRFHIAEFRKGKAVFPVSFVSIQAILFCILK